MKQPLDSSLAETLATSDLAQLTTDEIDEVLEAVTKIPIISALKAMYKTCNSVSNYLFMKKMVRFLFALKTVSQSERNTQFHKLVSNKKERRRIGESLLLIIDRLDNMDKPQFVARAFKAFIRGAVSLPELKDLCRIIEQLPMDEFTSVRNFFHFTRNARHVSLPLSEVFPLFLTGLMSLRFDAEREANDEGFQRRSGPILEGDLQCERTNLGRLFYEVVLEEVPRTVPRRREFDLSVIHPTTASNVRSGRRRPHTPKTQRSAKG